MARGSFELQGMEALLLNIEKKLSDGADRIENKALREAGDLLAEAQKSKLNRSDVNQKHMQDDIKRSGVRRKDGLKFVVIGPGKSTNWRAHFTENGTSHSQAVPFIYPSFYENTDRIMRMFADAFREGMQ